MSWNATVDRLRARAQHHDLATDEYTRRLLYQAVDEITRLATDRIGGPTTVVKELETENRRLRAALDVSEEQRAERERVLFAETERLTDLLKESDDERLALKEHYPRLRSQLAAARAHLRTLQQALRTLDVHATARHPELIDIPASDWAAAFDGIDEALDYDPTLADRIAENDA